MKAPERVVWEQCQKRCSTTKTSGKGGIRQKFPQEIITAIYWSFWPEIQFSQEIILLDTLPWSDKKKKNSEQKMIPYLKMESDQK